MARKRQAAKPIPEEYGIDLRNLEPTDDYGIDLRNLEPTDDYGVDLRNLEPTEKYGIDLRNLEPTDEYGIDLRNLEPSESYGIDLRNLEPTEEYGIDLTKDYPEGPSKQYARAMRPAIGGISVRRSHSSSSSSTSAPSSPAAEQQAQVAASVKNDALQRASRPAASPQTNPWDFMREMAQGRDSLANEAQRRRGALGVEARRLAGKDRNASFADALTSTALNFNNRPDLAGHYQELSEQKPGAEKAKLNQAEFERWLAGERGALGQKQAGGFKALEIEDERAKEARKATGEADEFDRKTAKDSVDAEMARRKAALDDARLEWDKEHGRAQLSRMRKAESDMAEYRLKLLDSKEKPPKDEDSLGKKRLKQAYERQFETDVAEYAKRRSGTIPGIESLIEGIDSILREQKNGEVPGNNPLVQMIPDMVAAPMEDAGLLKKDSVALNQFMNRLKTVDLHRLTGAAATNSETARQDMQHWYGKGNAKMFHRAFERFRKEIQSGLRNAGAGFRPEVVQTYHNRLKGLKEADDSRGAQIQMVAPDGAPGWVPVSDVEELEKEGYSVKYDDY